MATNELFDSFKILHHWQCYQYFILSTTSCCCRMLYFSERKGSALCFGASQIIINPLSLASTCGAPGLLHPNCILPPHVPFYSINATGVDIASFSAMPGEEEVLLLPGLPLVNHPGENPEPGLWTFEIETPSASLSSNGEPLPVMIDYVHPGGCA